jgi:glycolate oxidase
MPLSEKIVSDLRHLVGNENVLTSKEDLIPYSFDGTAALHQMPGCVVFTSTTEQIAAMAASSCAR